MIASLPMYDWPEVRHATDAWWAGLARHLRDHGFAAPEALLRDEPASAAWTRSDLLVSQTCGYPFVHTYADTLALVATPAYAVDGCQGTTYCSVIVVRAEAGITRLEDLAGATAAYNAPDSLSGHLALRRTVAPFARLGRFFGRTVQSGSHRDSLALVRDGHADVAAIDCVSHALARRYRPDLVAGLIILARSPAAPALPYVTAARRGPEEIDRLRRALAAAAGDPGLAEARRALFIGGLEFPASDAYQTVLDHEAACEALGYPGLA